jgi:cytochrome c biogenesis protein CcmG/thiol:disulfide interchange protein DsbE
VADDPVVTSDAPTNGDESTPESNSAPTRRVAPFVALAVVVVFVGFFWLLAAADRPGDESSAQTPLIDKPAPEIVSTTMDGEPFDLTRRRGSWVVLNFFNSTCVPCIREHPDLVAFHEEQVALGADGAELYTVVFDDSDEPVREFFDENGGDWPIVRDPNGTIAVSFGMSQVPETWIVSPSGIVKARFIGQVTAEGLSATMADLRVRQAG